MPQLRSVLALLPTTALLIIGGCDLKVDPNIDIEDDRDAGSAPDARTRQHPDPTDAGLHVTPPVTVVVGDLSDPRELIVQSGVAYWIDTDGAHRVRVDLTNSNPERLADASRSVPCLAVDETYVYYSADGNIGRVRLDSGERDYDVYPGFLEIGRFTADLGNVYFAATGHLWRAGPGPSPQVERIFEANPADLRMVGERQVAWADPVERRIVWTGAGGEGIAGEVEVEFEPQSVAVVGLTAFVAGRGATPIAAVDLEHGAAHNLVDEVRVGGRVAAGAGFVYWADPGERTIERVPADGGEVETVVESVSAVQIALEGRALYWIGSGPDAVALYRLET